MATVTITLGVRLASNTNQRIKIENVNLDSKVELLKDEAAKKINLQKQVIELIYCGNILDDDATLTSCGVKSGVTVHVLKKKEQEIPIPIRTMSDAEIQQLVLTFHTFMQSYGYRTALLRMYRPEVLENLIATTPGLADDPVAIAMIQDPELLFHLSDANTTKRIADLHPSLLEAANHIIATLQEEDVTSNPNQPGTSSGYSYSLDALSDDDDMDSSSSDGARDGGAPLSRNHSYSAITTAQLAAAIANATGASFPVQSPGSSMGNSGGIITNEMFTQAMQQAFATANVTPPSIPMQQGNAAAALGVSAENAENIEAITNRLAPQLRQMHEMGLMDDIVNVQALQATNGDVQAAIDLVFSGVITSD